MIDRQILQSALAMGPDCLTLEQLESLTTESPQRNAHVAQCLRCQAELALLKSFESGSPLPDEGAAVAWISSRLEKRFDQIKRPDRATNPTQMVSWLARFFGARKMRVLVPAAAIVIMGVMSVILLRPTKEPELRAGVGTTPQVFRAQEVEIISPSGELKKAPDALQWKPVSGAAQYKVSIMEVDQTPLWTGETRDLTVKLPRQIRGKMVSSKPVLWQVTAFDVQGRVLATSQVQRFRVTPKLSGSSE
jgi:hypothetical protein